MACVLLSSGFLSPAFALVVISLGENGYVYPFPGSRYDLAVAVVGERGYAEAMALLQESLVIDWTDCPEVETIPSKVGGVPILKHSRMPADAIVENYRSGLPADEIAEVFQLPVEGVRRLLAYVAKQNAPLER